MAVIDDIETEQARLREFVQAQRNALKDTWQRLNDANVRIEAVVQAGAFGFGRLTDGSGTRYDFYALRQEGLTSKRAHWSELDGLELVALLKAVPAILDAVKAALQGVTTP